MRPIDAILDTAIALNATDIHLQAGLPPVYRVQKRLVQKGGARLGPQETEELVFSLMTDQQKRIFREKLDHDFSCAVPGRARFRVNAFRQRDSVAAALRRIPFEIPSFESLGLPASMADLARCGAASCSSPARRGMGSRPPSPPSSIGSTASGRSTW